MLKLTELLKNCYCRRSQLVSIEESWNSPMSGEIPTRQQQTPHSQRNGASQAFQKSYPSSTTQASSSAYHSTNAIATNKTFKTDHGKKSISSTYTLPPHHQVYNYFQQSGNILNGTTDLGLMQHFQLRLQQNQQTNSTTPTKPHYASEAQTLSNRSGSSTQETSTSFNSAQNSSPIRNCDNPPMPPNPFDRTNSFTSPSKDFNKNIDEDLKNIISQKNLATTITENFLRTFGSDDIDVKDTDSSGSFGKSFWRLANTLQSYLVDLKTFFTKSLNHYFSSHCTI